MNATGMIIDIAVLVANGVWRDGVEAALANLRLRSVPVVIIDDNTDGIGVERRSTLLPIDDDRAVRAWLIGDGSVAQCFPRPGLILRACQEAEFDLFSSWVLCTTGAGVTAASQAGCVGAVLIGDAPEPNGFIGCTVARAADLADAPRVMIPPGGGCWH